MAKVTASSPTAPSFESITGSFTPTDPSVWGSGNAANNVGWNFTKDNSQAVLNIQAVSNPSGAGDYEHMGVYSSVYTAKPSPDAINRDAVGGDFRGFILPGNMYGRAWGLYAWAEAMAGADGFVVGHEIGLFNYGSDQPTRATITSKYALNIVSEKGRGTGAIDVNINPSNVGVGGFHHGLTFGNGTLTGTGAALRVPNSIPALSVGDSNPALPDRKLIESGADNLATIGGGMRGLKMKFMDASFNEVAGVRILMVGPENSHAPGYRQVFTHN